MTSRFARFALVFLAAALLAGASRPAAAQTVPTVDDWSKLSWRWIGPVNFSGRITEFAAPRGQTTTFYVLTASGGLWKTEDAGIHFEPIFDRFGSMSLGYLAIAPSDPKILYLGTGEPMHARSSTHGDGVWKSVDAGKTWTRVGLERSFFIPKVAVDPKSPDVVYVAAEGKLYDNAMDCERGLYKTTDGGKTWTNVFPVKDRGVADFVVDPRDAKVVIAAAYKTYRRAWTYMDRHEGNNLYKTTDGGATWKPLTQGLPVGAKLGRTGLVLQEKNPSIVYARLDEGVNLGLAERDGAANFRAGGFGGRGGGLFAEGWTMAKLKNYRIPPELAKQAPKLPSFAAETEADLVKKLNEFIADKDALAKAGIDLARLNAAARKTHAKSKSLTAAIDEVEALQRRETPKADSSEAKGRAQVLNRHALEMLYGGILTNQQPVKRNGVVYRSDDLGETWKRMTEYKTSGGSAQVNQTEGGYYGRIYVDPDDEQIVYCPDTNVTMSKDGGKTFAVVPWDNGSYKLHVDHRGLWIDPANGQHIMSANDGGAGESWDGGKHWHQKSTISAQQFYDVAVDNEQPYSVMGGTQDNGAWIGPSRNRNQWGVFANDWTYLPTGDGFYVVRDWWNPEWIYYESQFGASSRMNLRTGESQSLAKRTTPEEAAAGVPAQRYQWNAPIVLSPHNPGIVFICSQFVHRSLSRGERDTFVTISPDLSKADKAQLEEAKETNLQWATIYSFAESAKKPGLYWAGTDDGNLWMSPDFGATWVSITDKFYDRAGKPKPVAKGARIPYDKWVKRVVPSAFDENVCYVAFSGYRTHSEDTTWLYVTRDKGQTFEDISGGLQNPLFDVEEDPDNASVLYIAGDAGIHATIDGGKTWTPISNQVPKVVVRDMAIQKREREMAIATYGRGIYIADIGPAKEFKPEVFAKDAHLFDVKDVVRWNVYERKGEQYGEFAKVDNPAVTAAIYYYLKADAASVKVTIKDLEGSLIQEIASGSAKKGLQKVAWGLNKQAPAGGGAGPARPGGPGGARGGLRAENGVYKVALVVDGKEVAAKKMAILPDPMFK